MVLFDVAAKGVVFCGTMFICWYVDVGASGCIMVKVDTTAVAILVLLLPCSGTGSVTGTRCATAASALW